MIDLCCTISPLFQLPDQLPCSKLGQVGEMQYMCALTNAGVQLTLAAKWTEFRLLTESAASVNMVKWLLLFFQISL